MTADPRDRVSGITEIPKDGFGPNARNFASAWGWGTAAFAILLPIGMIADGASVSGFLGGMLLCGFVGALFVIVGLLLIGLPTTLLLKAADWEMAALYGLIGALAGAASIALLFSGELYTDNALSIFAGVGGIAGGATAYRWGRWREAKQSIRNNAAEKPNNPFHDMIH